MRYSKAIPLFASIIFLTTILPNTHAAEPTTKPTSNPAALAVGNSTRIISADGRDRSYFVHVPPKYDRTKPTAVVLAFHGASMNGMMMSWFSGLNQTADASNFIVAYPNGTGVSDLVLFFNAFFPAAPGGPPDDVTFTSKIIDDLESAANVDPKRVYATGMSNGGFMCYRLAAELSDRIAAIAPVAGTLAVAKCDPKRPISVIAFHGSADTLVPFEGMHSPWLRNVAIHNVQQSIDTFVKIDGCPKDPKTTELPHAGKDESTTVKRDVYGPGQDGTEVILYTIENGGHTWPGRNAPAFLGKSTNDISANDLIWAFFQKHPMK